MKTKVLIVTLVFVTGFVLPVQAQRTARRTYSTGAYSELEAGEGFLGRVSDWFATLGKPKEEKAVIKARRRAARKIERAREAIARKKKEIAKKKKKAMREIKKREEDAE